MRRLPNLTTFILLATITSCQSPVHRLPSSVVATKDWGDLRDLKQRNVELAALSVQYQKKKNDIGLDKVQTEQKEVAKKINDIETNLNSFDSDSRQVIANKNAEWRVEKERINLQSLDLYTLEKNVEFQVSTFEARQTEVTLSHKFFSKAGFTNSYANGYSSQPGDRKPSMNFIVSCDAPFEVNNGIIKKTVKANTNFKFDLGDSKISHESKTFHFHSNMNTCSFKFGESLDSNSKTYGFKLVNETTKLNSLKSLISTTEICTVKKHTGKFFETTEFSSMTCPGKYDSIKVLPEPEDSLHARVVALLGHDLPSDFIKNGNPYAELDFSKAPKFDAILVSYLVFRADFYGTLIARLLAHHADQGTIVRIIVSEVIALDKDEAMFEKLMAQHPNMKVIEYKFDKDEQGGAWISEFHRTNHVKLFAAYSSLNPQDSFVIMGGRNIHDGFVFKTPVDVSKYPEIVNYVSGDESWAYWRDFEMVIHGQNFVESVVRNYMNFYHINKENLVMKISSVAVQKDSADESVEESLRYYVSIPFKDEPNLNLFYARMIDSSKKKILISSPYFRPVKEIADALDRAVARGVDITVITRLDLDGDTADFILGAVNKDGVNHYLSKIKVYEYTEPKVILHSKLIMIDDEISFISSVNLNKRSFFHDLENGVVVNDKKFTQDMGELYKEYLKLSRQLTEQQKIIFWKKWLIKVLDKVF